AENERSQNSTASLRTQVRPETSSVALSAFTPAFRARQFRAGGLDPLLGEARDLVGTPALAVDGRADDHGDGAVILAEAVPRPEPAGVVRHRHHLAAALRGEESSARLVLAPLSRRNARSFREHHVPGPAPQPFPAFGHHGAQGAPAGRAIDGYGFHEREPPAVDGDPEQLALQHPDLRGE